VNEIDVPPILFLDLASSLEDFLEIFGGGEQLARP